jgi:aminoglycoside phosphotransferase (APT) family kinase protein
VADARYWLFIEKVLGTELWQIGDLEVWRGVARWLAGMHETLAGSTDERHLIRYDAAFYTRWARRAAAACPDLEPLMRRYQEVVERLLALPVTVIHGEFYPSNVLVAGQRVCPVDWEMTAVGPGLIDLAALTTGWGDEERVAIASAYMASNTRASSCVEAL